MKRSCLFIPVACLAIFITLISFSTNKSESLTGDVLSQTNQFRKSKGLPALVMRDDLNAIAQKHSADMAKGRVGFGHSGFDKRNAMATRQIKSMRSFAENVAYGARNAREVVTMWKNSYGHRRNMLGRYKYIGIGTAKDRQGRIFYTQVFVG